MQFWVNSNVLRQNVVDVTHRGQGVPFDKVRDSIGGHSGIKWLPTAEQMR